MRNLCDFNSNSNSNFVCNKIKLLLQASKRQQQQQQTSVILATQTSSGYIAPLPLLMCRCIAQLEGCFSSFKRPFARPTCFELVVCNGKPESLGRKRRVGHSLLRAEETRLLACSLVCKRSMQYKFWPQFNSRTVQFVCFGWFSLKVG